MLKKMILFFAALVATTAMYAANAPEFNAVQKVEGGVIEYEGTIGQYPVEFTFMNLHMGNGQELYYTYKTIKVNNGKPIELVWQRDKGRNSVYYEYINGKHTGTFVIIRTSTTITGTFRNSKGKTFSVNAHVVKSNYVEEE